jgi:hypothetical protein
MESTRLAERPVPRPIRCLSYLFGGQDDGTAVPRSLASITGQLPGFATTGTLDTYRLGTSPCRRCRSDLSGCPGSVQAGCWSQRGHRGQDQLDTSDYIDSPASLSSNRSAAHRHLGPRRVACPATRSGLSTRSRAGNRDAGWPSHSSRENCNAVVVDTSDRLRTR